MKRSFLLIMVAIILLVSIVVGFAASNSETPNDPTVNPNANACYTGGSMAGKCQLDDELWKAGWYAIRFEYGLISSNQVPDQYKWLLTTPHNGSVDTGKPITTEEP